MFVSEKKIIHLWISHRWMHHGRECNLISGKSGKSTEKNIRQAI